ncbi:MAG: hypothetical protein QGH76_03850 [Phycisphaerales bacterium]|nr:hypothetical protein [Phycisphaerales bacterium]
MAVRIQLISRTALSMMLIGLAACADANPRQEAQRNIEDLSMRLSVAVRSDDETALDRLAKEASRLQVETPAQEEAKAGIKATAEAHLATLQYEDIVARANDIVLAFHVAVDHATQAALLRAAGAAMQETSQERGVDVLASLQDDQRQRRAEMESQLQVVNARIATLQTATTEARQRADALREEADGLLREAQERGPVEGFNPLRKGLATIRQAEGVDLDAASSALRSEIHAQRSAGDAQAEVDGIAVLLTKVRDSMDRLGQIRGASREGAASLRTLADEFDANAAEAMSKASSQSAELTAAWGDVASMLDRAYRATSRAGGNSRESRATAAARSLNLLWTLGRIQEAYAAFLSQDAAAVSRMIDLGVITSASTWQERASSLSSLLNDATAKATATYEQAKQVAGKLGNNSAAMAAQLDRRIAALAGELLPPPAPEAPPAGGTTSAPAPPASSPATNSGFQSPEALVAYLNDLSIENMPPLDTVYVAKSSDAKKMLAASTKIMDAGQQAMRVVRDRFGDDGVAAVRDALAGTGLEQELDPASVTMVSDTEATVRDGRSGTVMTMVKEPRGWMLSLDSIATPAAATQLDAATPLMVTLFNTLAQQVKAGTIQSVEQLSFAISSALMGGGV